MRTGNTLLVLLSSICFVLATELSFETRLNSINRITYVNPKDVAPLHISPASQVNFEYDEYTRQYDEFRFSEFEPNLQNSFTVQLPGDWNQPQAFYFQAKQPGLLEAEVALLYNDASELQGSGFDLYIHNIYHRYEISSQTMMYVKLIRAQFEEGSYLIIFRNRDPRPKRIRFDCSIKYIEFKQGTIEGMTPLEQMVSQTNKLTDDLRNMMKQHTEDLMETATHARMHRDSFSRQLTYTILETALVLLANAVQLYYIRRLFESKSPVYG